MIIIAKNPLTFGNLNMTHEGSISLEGEERQFIYIKGIKGSEVVTSFINPDVVPDGTVFWCCPDEGQAFSTMCGKLKTYATNSVRDSLKLKNRPKVKTLRVTPPNLSSYKILEVTLKVMEVIK